MRRIIIYISVALVIVFAVLFLRSFFFITPARNHYLPNMLLTSSSFNDKESIPKKFTCDGYDINPELLISNVPAEARSLALIVDDPDAKSGTFTHWTVWNIDPGTTFIKEESKPPGSVEGVTGFGRNGYGGPCPPNGTHRYFFKLFALNAKLDLPETAKREELERAIGDHKLAETQLMGIYTRK